MRSKSFLFTLPLLINLTLCLNAFPSSSNDSLLALLIVNNTENQTDPDAICNAGRAIGFNSLNWQSISQTGLPGNGSINYNEVFRQWAYSCQSNKILYFPQDGTGMHTWLFDLQTNTWTESVSSNPGIRIKYVITFDSIRNRAYLFGGCDAGCSTNISELWSWDFNAESWSLLSSGGITARNSSAIVYDPVRDSILLFGGATGSACTSPGQALNETWKFDLGTSTWSNLSPTSPPNARCLTTGNLTYDKGKDLFILYGGNVNGGGTSFSETCIFDPIANSWNCSTPASSPSTFDFGAMVYVDSIGNVIRWGGSVPGAYTDELLSFDSTSVSWTVLADSNTPVPRNAHGLVYDLRSDRLLMYGGRNSGACSSNTCFDMNAIVFNP